MKSAALFIVALLSILAVPSPAADNSRTDPVQTVQSFYDYHFKHDMGFGEPEMKARKAWLSPELYALITKALKKPVPKGDAPDIEGDIFTDSQEYPTAFHVGKAIVKKETAKVEVTFSWSREKRQVTLILAQVEHLWRIVDIDYGDHRSLVKGLQEAAR